MKQEIIDKLPPDAQKEFLKLAMKLESTQRFFNFCQTRMARVY
jgi:hypothetical protein